jgi:hypothetical protein
MTVIRENSAWQKQKCCVLLTTSSARNAPCIVEGIITCVFTSNIEDIWKIAEKKPPFEHGRQSLIQNLKSPYHCHTVPNGSLLMIIFKGKRNDP